MFVKQSSNPYKIRKKIYKHFYKQNKYQQFAGIFSFAKQLVEEKIMGNVYVQKRGKVYQYQFAIASIDGKRKYKNIEKNQGKALNCIEKLCKINQNKYW